MTSVPRITSFLLTPLLVVGPLFAQTPGSLQAPGSTGETLQLHVLEGDGAQIAPGSRSNKGFSVQVTDAGGTPVSDAAVVFRLPDGQVTGTFADGSHSAVAYTDITGSAHVSGIQWSSTPGPVEIRVTATRGTAHAGTLIEESLAAAPAAETQVATTQTKPAPQAASTKPEALAQEITPPAPSAPKVQILSDIEPSARNQSTFAPMIRESGTEPTISIVNSPHQKESYGSGKKKWILIGIAAAAGAGTFFALHSMGGSSAPNLSIGAPSISIGH